MKLDKGIPDKWFLFPIIVLGTYFIIRLINQSQMLFMFPLDYTNDFSSYMAQLFFLDECGFHKLCPYWYNGFISFKYYPPGWYFFTYPLYLLLGKNVLFTTYLSMILLFIIGFFMIFFLGKTQNFSVKKRVAYFILFFGNAIAIGNFIRLGRITELFSWITFFAVFIILLWYKDHKIDRKFLLIIPLYSLLTLAHQTEVITIQFLFLGLFLIKQPRERLMLVASLVAGLLLSSFWWIPFLQGLWSETSITNYVLSRDLLKFNEEWILTNIISFLVVIALYFTFYLYWKSNKKSKKELLFFSPLLMLGLLFFTRLVIFIPILNRVYPDPFIAFFLVSCLYFLMKIDFSTVKPIFEKAIFISLLIIPVASVSANVLTTPNFTQHTQLEKDTLKILNEVDGKFLLLGSPSTTSYSKAYYSYAPIYLNLTTSAGWADIFKDNEYNTLFRDANAKLVRDKDCEGLRNNLDILNTTNLITYNDHCNTLKECSFIPKSEINNVCLFKTK